MGGSGPSHVLEERVRFDRELSLLAVRGRDGDTRFWPLVENVHEDGILRTSRAPAAGAPQAEAEAYATKLLDELGYVGVLALELFDVGGRLLANEFAPRVHNTGHWTIEGAPRRASSRTTCARSSACRSARPSRGPRRWST